jgi:hypothetical protein
MSDQETMLQKLERKHMLIIRQVGEDVFMMGCSSGIVDLGGEELLQLAMELAQLTHGKNG